MLPTAHRRRLRPSMGSVSRNVIIACAGLCSVALAPQLALAQVTPVPVTPQTPRTLNPDTEILVALNAGRYRLSDDITAAPLNGSLCVDVQQLFGALDFPILVDRSRQVASGWFISESRSFSVDLKSGAAEVAGKKSIIPAPSIGNVSTGPCVTIDALSSLLGLTIEYASNGSLLTVRSTPNLPLLDRLERQSRTKTGAIGMGQEGVVPRLQSLPYRAFVIPNTDVSLTLNRQQSADSSSRIAATWSVSSVGELAYMTAEAQFTGTEGGINGNLSRVRLYRNEYEGGVFGIAKLTEFSVGDIAAYGSTLGANGGVGLGFSVSSFPLTRPTAFDSTSFEGALPSGWDVELYRNGQLLEFRNDGATGGYSFKDVPVVFGDNNFDIVQYGPQGQRRVINKRINASNFLTPRGEQYYRAAIYRPEVLFGTRNKGSGIRIDLRSSFGIGENFNLGAGFDSYVLGNRRLSIGTISALTSVSGIALNGEIVGTSDGFFAGQIEIQGSGKGASIRGRATLAQEGFETERFGKNILARIEASADRSFSLSNRVNGTLTGRAIYNLFTSGESSFTARQRLTLSRGNSWLAQSLTWSHSSSGRRRDNIDGEVAYRLRRGLLAYRAAVEFAVHPTPRIDRLSVGVERSFGVEQASWRWRVESSWQANDRSFVHSFALGREFKMINLDLVAETDGKQNHQIGVSLSFSLGRRSNGWGVTSRTLASAGTVRARLFEDMDDNGTFSAGDVPLAQAGVMASSGRTSSMTDANGYATLDSLAANTGSQINVITDDLADASLYARTIFTKPREGTVSEVSIPLTKMGSIEGTVAMVAGYDSAANPLGGVTLALLNSEQKEVSRTVSAYDGYYSFDLVPIGSYSVVLAPDTSLARRLRPIVPVQIATTREAPGAQVSAMTLVETNPTYTKMALRGLL